MVRMIRPEENAVLPVIVIFPTFTLGPSSMLKMSVTAFVPGSLSKVGLTVAYWRPCTRPAIP